MLTWTSQKLNDLSLPEKRGSSYSGRNNAKKRRSCGAKSTNRMQPSSRTRHIRRARRLRHHRRLLGDSGGCRWGVTPRRSRLERGKKTGCDSSIAFKSRSHFYKDFLNLAPHVPALDDPQHEDAARSEQR